MGCGISTLDTEDASLSRRSMRKGRRHGVVPPVTANNYCILPNKKDSDNGDDDVAFGNNSNNKEVKPIILSDEEVMMKRKEVGSNDDEGNSREKCLEEERAVLIESRGKDDRDIVHAKNGMKKVATIRDEHEENEYRDDSIIFGPGSPSFRDYCIDQYDSVDRSSVGDSNDCDSEKNCSDDDSTNMKNKLKKEENVNCNKEPEKKEGRGRGIRNAMNKRKAKGRRNLRNFGCYSASSESHANGSVNKIVGKTA